MVLGIGTICIEAGRPCQNGHVESFHKRLRAERLEQEIFLSVVEARVVTPEQDIVMNLTTAEPIPSVQDGFDQVYLRISKKSDGGSLPSRSSGDEITANKQVDTNLRPAVELMHPDSSIIPISVHPRSQLRTAELWRSRKKQLP